jgi:hypothetical protein
VIPYESSQLSFVVILFHGRIPAIGRSRNRASLPSLSSLLLP